METEDAEWLKLGNIEKLKVCLEQLGGWCLDSLSNRKILQKKIYFLQQFDFDLGYSFGFYVYGPYSPELTDDAYFLDRSINEAPETIQIIKLTDTGKEKINKTKEFLDEFSSQDIKKTAHEIEVLASLHFLWNFSHINQKSKEKIFDKLKNMKKFQTEEMDEAWELLKKYALIQGS